MEIKIVVKEPGKSPKITTIENTLTAMQKVVGGYIEVVEFGEYDLVCNEEGKLQGLAFNFEHNGDVIVGPVFISKTNEDGENVSLSDAEAEELMLILGSVSESN